MADKKKISSDKSGQDVTLELNAQEISRQTAETDGEPSETIVVNQADITTNAGDTPGLMETIAPVDPTSPAKSQIDSRSDVTGDFTVAARDDTSISIDVAELSIDSARTGEFSSDHDYSMDDYSNTAGKQATQAALPKKVGDYKILGLLGRGGMGVVYHAKHRKLGREVALKMILAGGHASPEQLQRFIIEAQAVAHLQHNNIVQIFEVSEEDGVPFFSLEYVDGQPLDVQLKYQLPEAIEAATLMETLARAMQYAHDHGIIHRDLKPANVLISKDGVPKVTDFGLAKKLDDADDSSSTRTGTIMGTPSYMSPEQARGEVHELGPATDQYSLGAMLYEFLTGKPPFLGAKPLETILQVVKEEPIPPRQLRPKCPADLETICLKALQKLPESRYGSCTELADDLKRFIVGEPILARPVGLPERVWRWCKRNPKIAIPSAAALVMMLLATTISTWSYFTVAAKNRTIATERDNAKTQETIAKVQEKLAKEQQALAESRERVARKQSKLALDSLQFVQTNIDSKLKVLPNTAELRIDLMKAMADKWKELEVKLTGDATDSTGEQGEAVATLMASQGRTAESLMQLGRVQEADDIYADLVQKAEHRLVVMEHVDAARFNLAYLCLQRSATQGKLSSDPQVPMELNRRAFEILENIKAHPKPKKYDPATDDKTPEQREADRKALTDSINDVYSQVLTTLGSAYMSLGELAQASQYFLKAYEQGEAILAAIRGKLDFESMSEAEKDNLTAGRQLSLDTSGLALAYIYLRLGRTEESIKRYEAAIASRREIVARRPKMAMLQSALAGFLGNYGNAYLWLDRPEDAKPLLEESLERTEALHAEDPKNAKYSSDLATTHYRMGTLLDISGDTPGAAKHFESCKTLRKEAVKLSPNDSNKQKLMLALGRCGDMEAALVLINEFGANTARNGELHLERARALAQLSRHVSDEQVKSKMIGLALDALVRSIQEGYSDPFRVQAEQDLDPLHAEPRFNELIDSMQKFTHATA